ncbi:uracil-DNA glycosylase family protein [Caballeronia sp.]|uniref:uracil-DNA glycosylase n=1 Tax=Caballeronia sp. TaxID=1931223 RepID=UPI003C5EEC24
MPLNESMLEEFGLGTVWVRRQARAVAADEDGEAVSEAASKDVFASVSTSIPVSAPVSASASESAFGPTSESTAQAEREGSAASLLNRAAIAFSPERGSAVSRNGDSLEDVPARTAAPLSARQTGNIERRVSPNALAAEQRAMPPIQDAALDATADMPPPPAFDDLPWLDDLPQTPVSLPDLIDDTTAEIATLDWDTLAARVSVCDRCRLCERRTHAVFGVGDREADWMLVGEAPGENEDKQGEPFVGPAGKLLDSMLHAVTLSREDNVFIANVIKCRPPGNRNPEPDEVARCEPYLKRQVALVKPKVIVALGRFAANSLLNTDASVGSLRGRVHDYEGVPVIVTYHPAYLLRSLPDKAKAWVDLCLAQATYRASKVVE